MEKRWDFNNLYERLVEAYNEEDKREAIPQPDGNSDDLTGTDWERKEKK